MLKSIKNDLLYLLNILEAIGKIILYSQDSDSAEEFYYKDDQLNFNATLNLFTQMGENISKLSDELKCKYSYPWDEARGFINRIAHDYSGLDVFLVFQITQNDLKGLKNQVVHIINPELKNKTFENEELKAAIDNYYYRHINFDEIT
jgi:uncharacterized protein with HEPN domain